ncbi:replication initiation protein [Nitratiruptor tergarcus]|uniref:Initiator Replication protein n=1 Tax=Nitratiruptor tergarcus DSM 16512 TaxID=1069081 RepID=A0A1W1WV32_9BACT|nr:replication initiation protein [Nitratiruptor tergarcus]SMC10178.1 Initiator Replication protein [Nitratiruptor tergarcus DSM 16512]
MKKEIIPAKVIKKHNSLTDGYIPKTPKQVLPDRLLNALYYKYEREGVTFTISLPDLKELLGLQNEKDDTRIYEAIGILQNPIQIRDFHFQGKAVSWLSAPFLARAIRWKEKANVIEFKIEPMIVEALKQKAGYTPLDIEICSRFRTKYGLKLYEMYRRYSSLPHKDPFSDNRIGIIKKSLQELNQIFGTHYKTPSKLLSMKETKTKPPINRGLEEIKKITGDLIYCFYDKQEKKFIFTWNRKQKKRYPNDICIVPTTSIEPFANWYMEHFTENIANPKSYLKKLQRQIVYNKFDNLEKYYHLYLLELGKDPKKCFDPETKKFII